ncbi:nitroreductase family protein [Bradyrhizobium elkanii]
MNSNTSPAFSATHALESLRWCYATKTFDPARKVSDADLEASLEVIRLIPSSLRAQPFHVMVVSDPSIKQKISRGVVRAGASGDVILRSGVFGPPQIVRSSPCGGQ